jgi:electron transfer flavoprotein alpha subunit
MADILVYAEARNGKAYPVTLELLTAARELATTTGGQVDVLVLEADPTPLVTELGAADRVLTVSHPALVPYTPEAHLAALVSVVRAREPAAVLFSYSTMGLDLASALAACTDRPLIAYASKLTATGEAVETESQVYGGKLRATVRAALPVVLALMPGAYKEAGAGPGAQAEVIALPPPAELAGLRTEFVAETGPAPGGIDLTLAEKIVCVGRGIKDKDSVDLARDVADALGAELAGSRPVVDSGWLPKERQVGKSGTKVKPKLYLAVGVSGAPEHLEGMSGADLIVAINVDAKAPIFAVAHFGTTCDLFDLLPELSQRLGAMT